MFYIIAAVVIVLGVIILIQFSILQKKLDNFFNFYGKLIDYHDEVSVDKEK